MTPEAPEDAPRFALILERESPKPDAEIGRTLALHLPIPASDAIARVRYGGGLIVRGISSQTAIQIAASLSEIGVRARMIDGSLWGPVPRGRRVGWLAPEESSLRARIRGAPASDFRGAAGRDLLIPREDILGLGLMGMAPPPPPRATDRSKLRRWSTLEEAPEPRLGLEDALAYREPMAALLLEARSRGAPESSIETPSLSPRGADLVRNLARHGLAGMRFQLTLYALGSTGLLRLEKDEIDFNCLGDLKQEHSLDNFLLLLEELLSFLPAAWNRARIERFLADLDPRSIVCSKEEEAQNFDRWMLQWMRMEEEGREERKGVEP